MYRLLPVLVLLAFNNGTGSAGKAGDTSDTADATAVRTWITLGATEECTDPVDTSTDGYHPDGWSAPDVHGYAAKFQEEECVDCHGADLTGSGDAVSCDSCHEEGWRTDCTWCHGGTDNSTGAPPLHISGDDDGSSATFIPHTAHVEASDIKVAYGCAQCHTKPTDVLTPGHLFVDDDTPGRAETTFSAGLSDAASWNGSGTCSNLYCHGNGQGDNGSVNHTGSVSTCHDCHADQNSGSWSAMSGEHSKHLGEGVKCYECHGDTTNSSMDITDVTLHINGDADLALSGGVLMSSGTCSGSCHGEGHRSEDW